MLSNALTFWRDVTVLERRYGRHNTSPAVSTLQHIKLLSPDKMTSFAVKLKGTPLLEGFQ